MYLILFRAPPGDVSLYLFYFLEFLKKYKVCRSLAHIELVLAHRQCRTAREHGAGIWGEGAVGLDSHSP